MDYSKAPAHSEECCSNESGWTMYIASPSPQSRFGYEAYNNAYEDGDEGFSIGKQIRGKQDAKKNAEDVDSDDSMASDASSGRSYQYQNHVHGQVSRVHADNKYGNKQRKQQQEGKKIDEQKRAAKDKCDKKKSGAGESKKKGRSLF